jgi:hypothetical protein
VTIPALEPAREPSRLLSVRIGEFEHLVLRALARKEHLRTVAGKDNVTAVIQLAVAFMIRYMPGGWRPGNGKVLPEPDQLDELTDAGVQLADAGSTELAIEGLAAYLAMVLQGEGQTDEQILQAVSRFPA